ncbi:pyridoxal-phosphate dependent enzyme [Streptomyces sp. Y7]|uniref:pyridoxal-phosphate dependent enzyme n=1 Tax=Streptomyces sp. Y7 TaxID=3342392 RepID=UPI0037158681
MPAPDRHAPPLPRTTSRPLTLIAATGGNHGRAVARTARLLGERAHIFVPRDVHPRAVAAIAAEQAHVTEVPGPYDEAVHRAAEAARAPRTVLIQDTGLPGYERIPGWIVEGCTTLCAEIPPRVLHPAGVRPRRRRPGHGPAAAGRPGLRSRVRGRPGPDRGKSVCVSSQPPSRGSANPQRTGLA